MSSAQACSVLVGSRALSGVSATIRRGPGVLSEAHPLHCRAANRLRCATEAKACRRHPAWRAVPVVGRGTPSKQPGKAHRHHRATRGSAANAAVACRRLSTVCSLDFKQQVSRQAPMSRLVTYDCTVRSLNITSLSLLQSLIRSINVPALDHTIVIVAAISSDAVQPRRRGPVSTTRHEDRQLHHCQRRVLTFASWRD